MGKFRKKTESDVWEGKKRGGGGCCSELGNIIQTRTRASEKGSNISQNNIQGYSCCRGNTRKWEMTNKGSRRVG